MAKSKDFILPFWPKDLSNIIREGVAADTAAFRPGDLVTKEAGSNNLVLADTGNVATPKAIVWTDIANRFDVDGFNLDGTAFKRVTVLEGDFQADCKVADMFTGDPPAVGDQVFPSATPGKLQALTPGEAVTAFTSADQVAALTVGKVVGDENSAEIQGTGFVRVHFTLA